MKNKKLQTLYQFVVVIYTRYFVKNKKIVIYYHNITDDINNNSASKVSIDAFKSQIEYLNKAGFKFISSDNLIEVVKKNTKGKYCTIQFDDGFRDNYTNAAKILSEHNIPFDVFMITSMIGLTTMFSYTEMRYGQNLVDGYPVEFLSVAEISDIVRLGGKVYPHSHTHPMYVQNRGVSLSMLTNSELKEELKLSKNKILEIGCSNADIFVYPIGDYTENIIDELRFLGFRAAFTIENRPIKNNENIFKIPRIHPGPSQYTLARSI